MSFASAFILALITIIFPPIGVYLVAGCSGDLLVNICLTLLGFIPGLIHALYVEYVFYDRREKSRAGCVTAAPAPAIYSERVQNGGHGYGTIV